VYCIYFAPVGRLSSTFQYIRYYLQSRRWDSFHSPFLFQLFEYACDDGIQYPLFDKIEHRRSLFLKSKEKVIRSDFGAGSKVNREFNTTKVSTIAGSSLSLPFQCRFMSRLVKWTSAKTIVEFGTSLGISTAYLSAGALDGKIMTIEGDSAVALLAEKLFSALEIKNITVYQEKFEEFIDSNLSAVGPIDLVFIDGNHQKGSLLKYFHALLPYMQKHTIIIVDDIYWSAEMQSAWQDLINHSAITQSVECFHFGLLFFKPEFLHKENHNIHLPVRSYLR